MIAGLNAPQNGSQPECYCWDPRDCAAAEPCYTPADESKALRLLGGPNPKPIGLCDQRERSAIRRVAIALASERAKGRAIPRGRCRSNAEHDAHMCDGMPCGDWRDYEQPIGPYTQTWVIDLPGGIQ